MYYADTTFSAAKEGFVVQVLALPDAHRKSPTVNSLSAYDGTVGV